MEDEIKELEREIMRQKLKIEYIRFLDRQEKENREGMSIKLKIFIFICMFLIIFFEYWLILILKG
jgi:hypothetical protein